MINAANPRRVVTVMVASAAAVLTAATLAGCDAKAGPVAASPRQVTVIGSGQVQGAPDTVTADVGIEAVAPDATSAMNQTSDRQQAVISALTAGGIDAKDISTTTVSLQPQYGENSVITGYRAGNSIQVKIRKLEAASGALATIISTGGNTTRINSVNFSIDDDSQLVRDARARAFDDAKNRAQQYAELSGLSLGKVISISEAPGGISPQPVPMPMPR
ncbi:MAG: SIMPL domain-containing protein, partial [Mycobacterium sp.]